MEMNKENSTFHHENEEAKVPLPNAQSSSENQPSSKNNISSQTILDPIKPKPTFEKIVTGLNVFFTGLMVAVTSLLVYWASQQWEVMNRQWQAMNTTIELTKEMNKETKSLSEETIKYAREQTEAARKSVEASRSSADAANHTAQIAQQAFDLERLKSKAQLECWMRDRRLFVTVSDSITLSDSISVNINDSAGVYKRADTSTNNHYIQVPSKKHDTNKPAPTSISSEDDRTEAILICRNKSFRPTAVIDVYLRDKNGNHLGRIPRGYNHKIKVPLRVGPWEVTLPIEFRIEKEDDEKMRDLLVIDMDNKEYIIPCPSTRARQNK